MRVLFTDLDGTCVHYDWHEFCTSSQQADASGLYSCTSLDGIQRATLIRLPPSTTGSQGVISLDTLRLYAALRQLGIKLVVVTGARMATTLCRLPFIPAADAIVCEGGGRIFYPASSNNWPTAAPLLEDHEWRQQQAAAGPAGQDAVPPEQRTGSLWQLYAALKQAAPEVKLDSNSYTTAFRMKGPAEALAAAVQHLPEGLATALNLGAADVFPETSGKENAAKHLMARFGATPAECAFMCDDDNDLGLAYLVSKAYLPGITAESVRQSVAAAPQQFHVASGKGVFATEEILRLLITQQLGQA